jgi:hypothetical protein
MPAVDISKKQFKKLGKKGVDRLLGAGIPLTVKEDMAKLTTGLFDSIKAQDFAGATSLFNEIMAQKAARAIAEEKKTLKEADEKTDDGYVITVKGKKRYFDTLKAAKDAAEEIHKETGVVVGIDKDTGRGPSVAGGPRGERFEESADSKK